jgi:peptidoglycan/LPS O-acetylase OafA/YrhL
MGVSSGATAGTRSGEPRLGVKTLWVPTFDGIRGGVSLSIALTHISLATGWVPDHEPFRALRSSMFFSIEFLFLVGGFVAFLPAVVHGTFIGGRAYGLRRLGRILPVYWLTLVLAIALGPLLRPVSGANFPHDPFAVLGHVAFLQQELFPFRAGFGVQGIVWTMSIACIFYVLYPLIVKPYFRRPFIGLALAIGIAVLWRTSTRSNPQLFLQFPLFCADFAIGMTGAYIYVWLRRRDTPRLRTWLALACPAALGVLLYLLYLAGVPVATKQGFLWGESVPLSIAVPLAFLAFLVTAAYLPAWARWVFANRVARWVGSISYALFLFHFLVIWLVLLVVPIPRNGSPQSMLELTAIVLPITLTLAWLATRFIEAPVRRRAQALGARVQRPVVLERETEAAAASPEARPASPEPALATSPSTAR